MPDIIGAAGRPAVAMDIRRRTHLLIPLLLFVFLSCLYGLCIQGVPRRGDPEGMFLVARSLALRGDAALAPDASIPMVAGRSGRLYSKFAPGLPLAQAPFVRVAAAFTGPAQPGGAGYAFQYLAACACVALAAALCSIILYLFILDLGYSCGAAMASALACGAGSMLWPYAGAGFSEPLQALCLLGSLWAARRAAQGGRALPWAVVSGACAGWLGLTKPAMFVFAPLLFFYMMASVRAARGRALRAAAAWAVPFLVLVLATLGYNWLRFGDFLNFGYTGHFDREHGFGTPLLAGLYGLLFSPGKSVFVYAPSVLLGLAGARAFHRAHPRASFLCWAACAGVTLLYARWWAWHGDWAWGPRFLVPALPLALVPAAALFQNFASLAWWKRALAACVFAASVAVQVPGVAVHYGNHLYLVTRALPVSPFYMSGQKDLRDGQLGAHFVPELSPVAGHAWLLRHAIARGGPDPEAMARTAPWRTLLRMPDAMPPPDMLREAARVQFWHAEYPRHYPGAAPWAAAARNALALTLAAAALFLAMTRVRIRGQ